MKVIIIGNGISGITAARFVRKLSDYEITVISSESPYFFSRTALMYVYMGHMREEDTRPYESYFWVKNRIQLVQETVMSIDFEHQSIKTNKGKISYDKLVIASGSTPRPHPLAPFKLKKITGMYHIQDLNYLESISEKLNHAVVIGGGLIGIELAEMLISRNKKVSLIVREKGYWDNVLPPEESIMVSNHIKAHHIDLHLATEITAIHNDGKSVTGVSTNKGQKMDCDYIGMSIGVVPNIAFLRDTELKINRGIVVNRNLETNIPNVFAIGDCAEQESPKTGRSPIEAVWYTGRMMGETVAYNVCDKKVPYNPGIWFNSAKFLDIEYQVYGLVPKVYNEKIKCFYWQHSNENKSVRIVYDGSTQQVLGFNLMGIRYRHEVCEKWIAEKYSIEHVLQNLSLANFDPEFNKEYENDIIQKYNKQTGTKIKLQSKRNLNLVNQFLKHLNPVEQ